MHNDLPPFLIDGEIHDPDILAGPLADIVYPSFELACIVENEYTISLPV
jgi:hypothetical protein